MDLPKALDTVLKALLSDHSISSWKVAAEGQNPTMVLRLSPRREPYVCQDGVRVDTSAVYRRKPPSQINRDKRRMNNFRSRSDRATNETVQITKRTQRVKDDVPGICENRCDKTDIKNTVVTKDSDTANRVDIENRSLDSVARPEDTDVTGGEVSVTQTIAADAGSAAATLPTCSAPHVTVAVNKNDTVRREVAGVTHSDPGAAKGAHGGRREERVNQKSEGVTGGKGAAKKISRSDSSEWLTISVWKEVGDCAVTDEEIETKEVVRRSSRIEEKDVKNRDKYK